MSTSAKAAFVGYSYQLQVAILLVFLLEEKTYSLITIKPEIDADDNFDDIECQRTDSNENLYLQIKNTTHNLITFKGNKIYFNNNEVIKRQGFTNIIVTRNPHNLINNSDFNGFCFYKNDNLLVFHLPPEWITDYIFNNFSSSRIQQIIALANSKFTNYYDCEINLNDLPAIKIMSSDLSDKTLHIRNFKFENKKILFVLGKPGVGKSHLVNELGIPENRLYRFWISNKDTDKVTRLNYETFINQISSKLFNSSKKRTEEEIIDKLNLENTTFYIDGLDHVENYNLLDLENFFLFLEKANCKENIKIIVLTRPLNHKIDYPCLTLENWTMEESREYLNQRGIKDYTVITKITKMANGYPIITGFLASEWLFSGQIKSLNTPVSDITEYYKSVLSTVKTQSLLSLFSFTTSFFLYDEISFLLQEQNSVFLEFTEAYPFLFERDDERIALIHDSFNNYVSNKIQKNESLLGRLINYVEKSLMKSEARFMSRVLSYNLSDEFLSSLLHKFCRLDEYIKLKNSILDYESIKDFYYSLRRIYARENVKLLSPEEAYELSLIFLVLMRDNIEQSYGLLFQYYTYLKKNNINWKEKIFSSGTIYHAFSYFENRVPYSLYQIKTEEGYRKKDVTNELNNQLQNELLFFSNFQEDKYEIYKNIILTHDQYVADGVLVNMLVSAYLYNHDEDNLKTIIKDSFNGHHNSARYLLGIKLSNWGWKHITNFSTSLPINKAKTIILQLGANPKNNDYLKLSLKEIIQKYAEGGSFDLMDIITGYLRLANKKNKKVDILSINYYQPLYYQHKDYSIIGLSEIFYELIIRKKLPVLFAFETIALFQNMSDKGIRDLASELVNHLGPSYVSELENKGILSLDSQKYHVWFTLLSKEIINAASKNYVKGSVFIIINEKLEQKNRYSGGGTLLISDYVNLLNSDYSEYFKREIRKNNLVLKAELTDGGTGFLHKDSLNIDKEETTNGYHLDRGIVKADEKEYYKGIELDYLTFARCCGGWYEKLPYPNFLDLYDKKTLRGNVLKITQYIISKSFISREFDDERIENGSDRGLLSGLPQFYVYLNLNLDWNQIKSSLLKMLDISLGKI